MQMLTRKKQPLGAAGSFSSTMWKTGTHINLEVLAAMPLAPVYERKRAMQMTMAHHIFIHLILTVNHFFFCTNQSPVLLCHSNSRSCVENVDSWVSRQPTSGQSLRSSESLPGPESFSQALPRLPVPLHWHVWGCTVLCKDEWYKHCKGLMKETVLTGLPPEGMECKPLELSLGEFQDGKHVPTFTCDCNEH